MSFLGSLYAAAATKPRRCSHKRVVLFGSEETGLRSVACKLCGIPMTRRVVKGQYVYMPMPGPPNPYDGRSSGRTKSCPPPGLLDQLFMAAAPVPESAPASSRRKKGRTAQSPAAPRPFKPVRQAKATKVKLLTTAKMPLGSRHFERVAEIGPYVPGFYVVKNVDGRAVVYRRSAVEMRRYPAHLGYPCP